MRDRVPIFVADFETTVEIQYMVEGRVRVWAWAVEQVNGHQERWRGETIEEFIQWCEGRQCVIYFHNMKFDASFLLDYWLRNGVESVHNPEEYPEEYVETLIDNHGQFYLVHYHSPTTDLQIKDSLKKYRMPLEKVASIFQIPGKSKLLIGYRPLNREVTDWEWERVEGDVRILAEAMRYQITHGLKALTVSSDALASYKDFIGRDLYKIRHPKLCYEMDQILRKAYRGGWVYLNPIYKEKNLENVYVFDVNSEYPSIMAGVHGERLPCGLPRRVEEDYQLREDEVEIVIVNCTLKLKEGAFPWIHYKGVPGHTSEEYIYSHSVPLRLAFTTPDLELLDMTYQCGYWEVIDRYVFKSEIGQFKDFVDNRNAIKEQADKDGNLALRQQMKDDMNTLSGKFALNPNAESKVPYFDVEDNQVRYNKVADIRENLYVPTSAFITAYGRKLIVTAAMKFGIYFVYADTDSVHVLKNDVYDPFELLEVDKTKLGAFKNEKLWQRARYLRSKAYFHDMGPITAEYRKEQLRLKAMGKLYDQRIFKETEIKCGGMPDETKEFVDYENFFINANFDGKLVGSVVPGGYLLRETKYKIKEKELWRI